MLTRWIFLADWIKYRDPNCPFFASNLLMFAISQEYYRELGVPPHASSDEIKAAFRRKAMRWHPDRNKERNAEEIFKRIKSAYEVLSDAERRRAYDEEIRVSRASSASGAYRSQAHSYPFSSHSSHSSHAYQGDEFYTRHAHKATADTPSPRKEPLRKKGRELRRIIEIPLETAVQGGSHVVTMYMGHVCQTCSGEGDVPSSTCLTCFGTGHVHETIGHGRPCPDCRGSGLGPKLCPECLGTGLVQRMRTLKVSIPSGVIEGTIIRLREAGTESRSAGPRGDILFTLRLASHKRFRVRGLNLLAGLEVDFSVAWLGGKLRVRTLHGKIDLHVPPLHMGARILRLKGLGLKDLRSGLVGDLLVRVSDGRPLVAGYLPAPCMLPPYHMLQFL